MEKTNRIVVVGSCNIDLICYAPRLPKSGETLTGTHFSTGYGGKGCNQCVAAKKLGSNTLLVSRVGNDVFGKNYLNNLQDLKIKTDHVYVSEGSSTGVAQITVAESGENHIVIVPGANNDLSEKDLIEAEIAIKDCSVLMCQMEINWDCTVKAMEMKAKAGKGIIIFNGAPAVENVDPRAFSLPDIFCVNESEAETFTGRKVGNLNDAKQAIFDLQRKGCKGVIITVGKDGAVYASRGSDKVIHVSAESVTPIDTTGAGDAFVGALGHYLAQHPELEMTEIIKRCCAVATMSVRKKGTQESFPWLSELKTEVVSTLTAKYV